MANSLHKTLIEDEQCVLLDGVYNQEDFTFSLSYKEDIPCLFVKNIQSGEKIELRKNVKKFYRPLGEEVPEARPANIDQESFNKMYVIYAKDN